MAKAALSLTADIDSVPKYYHLSLMNHASFFKLIQHEKFLSESRCGPSGTNKSLNLVSKSGVIVSADQAIILAHSSYLKGLVDSTQSCGCAQDVPTLLLPQEEHQVVQALVDLLSSGSTVVPGSAKDDLTRLMRELRLELEDQLVTNISPSDRNTDEVPQIPFPLMMRTTSIKEDNLTEEEEDGIGEQNRIIKKLSYVLSFLQGVKIKNDEMFVKISKPLEDLLASLKYLPVNSPFDFLPTEIKKYILNYLCDSGVLIAGNVNTEWKNILNSRLTSMRSFKIGKHCSNVYKCEEVKCFMPEEMLEAILSSSVDELDINSVNLSQVPVELLAQTSGHVRQIVLDYTQLNTPQCLAVLETCVSSSTLVDLSMEGLNLAQVPSSKLREAAVHLQVLNLYDSTLKVEQCQAVLEACVASPSLMDLSIGGVSSLREVSSSLLARAASNLKELNLDDTELSTEQVVAVLETCSETSPLEVLNLGHMCLYDTRLPAQLLGQAACHLHYLDLFGSQPLQRGQIIALLEACVASATSNVGIHENLDYYDIPADLLARARVTGRVREDLV